MQNLNNLYFRQAIFVIKLNYYYICSYL